MEALHQHGGVRSEHGHLDPLGPSWDLDPKPPRHIRLGAAISIGLWAGVVVTGRTIAYDWFDCHKELPFAMYWAAGCVDEMAAFASE